MRCVTQRIEKQNIQILQLCERFFRNRAEVCQVGRASKTEADDFGIAMQYLHRFESSAKKIECSINHLQFNLSQTAELVIGIKNISKCISQTRCDLRLCVKRNFRAVVTQGAY